MTGEGTGELSRGLARVDETAIGARKAVAGLGAALATASGIMTGKAIGAASDWNDQVREMQRVTDEQTAAELSEGMRDLAGDIPLATNELANIATEAGRFGIEGSENIERFTETVAKMSTATNLTADEAGEAFAKLSELTGTPIDDVDRLGSSINEMANSAATSADEIVDNMMRSSSALSDMGASETEIVGLASSMNEMYGSSRRAGTALRSMGQEMMDPGNVGDLAEAFGMTSDEFKEMRDSDPSGTMQEMARMMKEGGDEADILNSSLSSVSRQGLSNLGSNLEDTETNLRTAEQAFEDNESVQREFELATESLDAKLQTARNTLNNIAIEIGQVFIPYVQRAADAVNEALGSVEDMIGAGYETEIAMGVAAAGVAGLTMAAASLASLFAGPAIAAVGGMVATLGGPFVAAFATAGSSVAALTGLIGTAAGSFGTLSAAGAALSGSIAAVTGTVGAFIAPVTGAAAAVGGMGASLIAVLGPIGLVIGAVGALGYAVKNNQEVIAEFSDRAIAKLESIARDGANWLEENGPTLVKKAFRAIGEGIRFVVLDIYKAITGKGDSLIKSIIIDAATWIRNNGPGILKRAIGIALDVIWAAFEGLYEGLIGNSIVPDMFTDMASYIRGAGKRALAGAAGSAASAVLEKFTGLAGDVAQTVSNMISDAKSAISNGVDTMQSTFNNAIPDDVGISESFSIPSATIGGGSVPGTDRSLPSRTIGGGRFSVNESIDLPQLDTGGYIEDDGLAYLHAGEEVVRKAEVDRSGDAGSGNSGGDTYKFEIYAPHSDAGEIRRDLDDEFRSQGF